MKMNHNAEDVLPGAIIEGNWTFQGLTVKDAIVQDVGERFVKLAYIAYDEKNMKYISSSALVKKDKFECNRLGGFVSSPARYSNVLFLMFSTRKQDEKLYEESKKRRGIQS